MKLAKKMLASALALAMVVALALTAFAATPSITMSATSAEVGKTITVTVAGKDIAGTESGDLVFNYDATALEFVSVKKAFDYDMATGGNPSAGEVTFSFAYLETATADNTICTIEFKVLKEGSSDVTCTIGSWNGTAAPATTPVKVSSKTTTESTKGTTETPVVTEPTSVAETTTKTASSISKTGEAGVAAIAGVMALAAVAFVVTRKKDAE